VQRVRAAAATKNELRFDRRSGFGDSSQKNVEFRPFRGEYGTGVKLFSGLLKIKGFRGSKRRGQSEDGSRARLREQTLERRSTQWPRRNPY
jgi:hypothetical protein